MERLERPRRTQGNIRFADPTASPLQIVGRRLALAVAVVGLITLIVYLDRFGYRDSADGAVDLLDAFYYATVSVTTTGYGDIVPVSDQARLVTAVVVTPLRALFLVLVVSTTVEILTTTTRYQLRTRKWRRKVRDHYVICGYGTKGRSAAAMLLSHDIDRERIVVVERNPAAIADAGRDGFVVIQGDTTRETVLEEAGVPVAKAVIVAVATDDTAVLTTLTAGSLNPKAKVVAAVREAENARLLRRSGASSVVVSDEATGRLLGLAVDHPHQAEIIEDLMLLGEGIDLVEVPVDPAAVGGPAPPDAFGVIRNGRMIPSPVDPLEAGDHLLTIDRNDESVAP